MNNLAKTRPCLAVSHKRRKQTLSTANVLKRNEFPSLSRATQYQTEEHFSKVSDCEINTAFRNETDSLLNSNFCSESTKFLTKYRCSTKVCYSKSEKGVKSNSSKHSSKEAAETTKYSTKLFSSDVDDSFYENGTVDSSVTHLTTKKVKEQTFQQHKVEISQQVEFNAEFEKHTFGQNRGIMSLGSTACEMGLKTSGFLDFDRDSIGAISQDDIDAEIQLDNRNALERNNTSRANGSRVSNHEDESQRVRQDLRMERGVDNPKAAAAILPPREQTDRRSASFHSSKHRKPIEAFNETHAVIADDTLRPNKSCSQEMKLQNHTDEIVDRSVLQGRSPMNVNSKQRCPSSCMPFRQSNIQRWSMSPLKSESLITLYDYDKERSRINVPNDNFRPQAEQYESHFEGDQVSLGSSMSSTSTYIISDRKQCILPRLQFSKYLVQPPAYSKNNSSWVDPDGFVKTTSSPRKLIDGFVNQAKQLARGSEYTRDVNDRAADSKYPYQVDKSDQLSKSRIPKPKKGDSCMASEAAKKTNVIIGSRSACENIRPTGPAIPDGLASKQIQHYSYASNLNDNKNKEAELHGRSSADNACPNEVQQTGLRSEENSSLIKSPDLKYVSGINEQRSTQMPRQDQRNAGTTPLKATSKNVSKSSVRPRYTMNKKVSQKSRVNSLAKQKFIPKMIKSQSSLCSEDFGHGTSKPAKELPNSDVVAGERLKSLDGNKGDSKTESPLNPDAFKCCENQSKQVFNNTTPFEVQCNHKSPERRPSSFDKTGNNLQKVQNPPTTSPKSNKEKLTPAKENVSDASTIGNQKNKSACSCAANTTQSILKNEPPKREAGSACKKHSATENDEQRPSLTEQLDCRRESSTVAEQIGGKDSYSSSQTPRTARPLSSQGSSRKSSPPAGPSSARMGAAYSYPTTSSPAQVKTLKQRQEEATRAFLSRQKASLAKRTGNSAPKESAFKITFPSAARSNDGRQMRQGLSFNQPEIVGNSGSNSGGGEVKRANMAEFVRNGRDFNKPLVKNHVSLPSTPRQTDVALARPRSFSPPLRRSSPMMANKNNKKITSKEICLRPNDKKSTGQTSDKSQNTSNNNMDMCVNLKSKFSNCCPNKKSERNCIEKTSYSQTVPAINEANKENMRETLCNGGQIHKLQDCNEHSKSVHESNIEMANHIEDKAFKENGRIQRMGPFDEMSKCGCQLHGVSNGEDSQLSCRGTAANKRETCNDVIDSRSVLNEPPRNVQRLLYEPQVSNVDRERTETILVKALPANVETYNGNRFDTDLSGVEIKQMSAQSYSSSSTCPSDERGSDFHGDGRDAASSEQNGLESLLKDIVKKYVSAYLEATLKSRVADEDRPTSNNNYTSCDLVDSSRDLRAAAETALEYVDRSPAQTETTQGCNVGEAVTQVLSKLSDKSHPSGKNPQLIQLFPKMKNTRGHPQQDGCIPTTKRKPNQELKHLEQETGAKSKRKKSKHVAYLLSEAKIKSENRISEAAHENFIDVVRKHFYAVPQKDSLVSCKRSDQQSTHNLTTSTKKCHPSVDDEYDMIPTKEKSSTHASIKAPLCLFGWVTNNSKLRHLETSINIHRNNPETDTVKKEQNKKSSSERSRRKMLAESKTSEDETEKKPKTKRRGTKKGGETKRCSELETGAMSALRDVEKISDARPPVGGGLKETLWAVTQINVFNDGSRTYEIMKPEKKRPPEIPDQTHNVFVMMAPRKKADLT